MFISSEFGEECKIKLHKDARDLAEGHNRVQSVMCYMSVKRIEQNCAPLIN